MARQRSNSEISLDDFEELKILGEGAFGKVFKMRYKPTHEKFAVKCINQRNLDEMRTQSALAKRELELSEKIGESSQYLVKFYGSFNAKSYLWIVQELMDTSLDNFCKKAKKVRFQLSEAFMVKVAFCVLNALWDLRQLKIMHRDVKPSNILLNMIGEIKLCDFGISGIVNEESMCKSNPERFSDDIYRTNSDVWSLGISLIEIAHGVHPFEEYWNSPQFGFMLLTNKPPRLDEKLFGVEFCSFVSDCLTKDPQKRPKCDHLLHKHPFLDPKILKREEVGICATIKLIIGQIQMSS